MNFTIYSVQDGKILRSGGCSSESAVFLQVGEGEAVLVGKALDDTKYRINIETGEEYEFTEPLDLASERRRAFAFIDNSAEEVRGLFITNTPSQPSIYLEKEKEALAVVAGEEAPTPNIDLEAARTGEARMDVAVVILTQANTWRQISAVIEDRRLTAKDQVRAAETVESILNASIVDWTDLRAIAPAG